MERGLRTIHHHADFAVVGGGLSGMCAAIEAARHGAKVALVQERPMLGGNASSEIRMWVCGARQRNMLETGILEEIMMENCYRNPDKNYSIWDGILYEIVRCEPNIDLILNCSVHACEMDGGKIASVSGWQMTTQENHVIRARYFADCSGDSILAPLCGAEYRVGREARAEFGESIAPVEGDSCTMGMSCMIQAREEDRPSAFVPPKWAYKFHKEDLPHRIPQMENPSENFWYMELGGEYDSIHDTEKLRDELLKIAYGIWDFVKNDPENREKYANWRLDWMGILPGKRESRRYVGDHLLNQNEVRAGGRFEDIVAYGGWPMDDHHPGGFRSPEEPTIFHPAPSPYGIPYRCLYSKNVENLFFAGRNISVTHCAVSSTRVMGTCALLGQAVGAAAAIAVRDGLSPRGVYEQKLAELKQTLMDDDCYLPFNVRAIPQLTADAQLKCAAENAGNLRNGSDRPIGENDNGCMLALGEAVELDFGCETPISQVRIVWDSDLNRDTMPEIGGQPWAKNMLHNRTWHSPDFYVPKTMTRAYRVEGVKADGAVDVLREEGNNYQRLNKIAVQGAYQAVRLIPLATWGNEQSHIFAFDVR